MDKFNSETTIQTEFSAMLAAAKSYFETNQQKKQKFHQCLILSTAQGDHITYPINTDSIDLLVANECTLFSDLKETKKTVIKKVVCMWDGGHLDVPSRQFMTTLCNLNVENRETQILLSAGTNAYVTKKIADIIG